MWLPRCDDTELRQAVLACAKLQYRDELFMGLLLQRADQMLQPNRRGRGRAVSESNRADVAAMSCMSVVSLDMRDLAGAARTLVASSKVNQQRRMHSGSLRRLWVFHSWLLEHQLLDGRGLAGLVTQQQLQQGAQQAAGLWDKTRAVTAGLWASGILPVWAASGLDQKACSMVIVCQSTLSCTLSWSQSRFQQYLFVL